MHRYQFDLSKKEEVFRFVRFLSKIEEHAKELEQRFEGVRATLLQRIRTPEGRASLQWTAEAQLMEYGLQQEPA